LINNYRKGWALRYLREAKADLTAAQKTPYMTASLVLEALRKAQAAIYFSLGDPPSIEGLVRQTILNKQVVKEPVLRCLVEIERTAHEVAQLSESDQEKAMKETEDIVQIASEIVKLFTDEKTD
jgi:hypothetical protein